MGAGRIEAVRPEIRSSSAGGAPALPGQPLEAGCAVGRIAGFVFQADPTAVTRVLQGVELMLQRQVAGAGLVPPGSTPSTKSMSRSKLVTQRKKARGPRKVSRGGGSRFS